MKVIEIMIQNKDANWVSSELYGKLIMTNGGLRDAMTT